VQRRGITALPFFLGENEKLSDFSTNALQSREARESPVGESSDDSPNDQLSGKKQCAARKVVKGLSPVFDFTAQCKRCILISLEKKHVIVCKLPQILCDFLLFPFSP
jgi:hypothetical protein